MAVKVSQCRRCFIVISEHHHHHHHHHHHRRRLVINTPGVRRLPGDVTGRVASAAAAGDAVRRVLLARLLQLGAQSHHLHHLQPRLSTSVSQDALRPICRAVLTNNSNKTTTAENSTFVSVSQIRVATAIHCERSCSRENVSDKDTPVSEEM